MSNEKELTHIDLFSGIGGFTLAAEWAGFKTIAFCEKEKFCQKVLKKHWSEIPIIEEIRDFDGTKYQGAALLTGGFPCQPFSVAGQQRGKEDDRYLWPEMLRVIDEAKPHWILAENVPGIFRMALDTVLSDLEGKGYTTGTFIIPACGLNAPHRRNRVWIVANYGLSQSMELSGSEQERRNRIGNGNQNACDTSSNRHQRRREKARGTKRKSKQGGMRKPERTDSHASDSPGGQRFQCLSEREKKGDSCESDKRNLWPESWLEVATRFCRVDDGISDRLDGFINQDEALRAMREFYDSAALGEQKIGCNICKEEILLKHLLWAMDRIADTKSKEGRNAKKGKKENKSYSGMRKMRFKESIAMPSQRSKYKEQFIRELRSSLSGLSSQGTHERSKLGSGGNEEEIQGSIKSVENRVGRLKALGNAIVPQIAYEILKNIAWIENELAK